MAESRKILQTTSSLLSDCVTGGLDAVLERLSLKAPKELQSGIFQLSSIASYQFLELIGIGAGFTSPDLTGFAIAQLNKKLEDIKKQIKTILGAPAIQAFDHLRRGMRYIEGREYSLAREEFRDVIKLSIQGRIYQEENLQTVANITQYICFSDVMLISFDDEKKVFLPYELLGERKQRSIKMLLTDHLDKLLAVQKKNKPKLFFKASKKQENQNIVDQVLKNCLQFLCPPGSPVPVNYIPDGVEDAAWINLDGKTGMIDTKAAIQIYKSGTKIIIRDFKMIEIAAVNYKEGEELMLESNQDKLSINDCSYNVKAFDLIELSKEGQVSKVKDMLNFKSIDVNATGSDGCTALMHASASGHSDVVDVLVQVPAINVNATNSDDWTALMWASRRGHSDVVAVLVQAPAIDINTKPDTGWTALHVAASYGRLASAKLLVEAGADLTAVSYGKTPAQWAKDYNKTDVYKYLSNCK